MSDKSEPRSSWPWRARRPSAEAASETPAQTDMRAQRRILSELADADATAWAWFPPVFVAAFTLLSFAGTYIGLRDIIAAGDARGGVVGDAMVFLLVALATGAMVFFLRRAVIDPFSLGGAAAAAGYVLLLFFSLTFGFAFYWGRLEASGQAIEGASARVESFSDQIQISAVALSGTASELTRLAQDFQRLAETERLEGGTCGDASPPGPGPRMRHRARRAQEIEARVAEISPRFAGIAGPVAALEAELKKIEALGAPGAGGASNPTAAREAQFQETRRKARDAAVQINVLAQDPALAGLAQEFKTWGREYQDAGLVRRDDPQGSPYQCIQFETGRQLLAAGERLSNLPTVSAPDLPDYVGPAATREAVFRMLDSATLGVSGGGALDALFAEEASSLTPRGEAALRSSVGAAVRAEAARAAAAPPAPAAAEARGLRASDRFPLAIAVVVDALLFAFVLIGRPGRRYFDRVKRRMGEAVREGFNPLRMVALRQALEEDPDWRLLKRYRFDVDDRVFIALPADSQGNFSADVLRDVVKVFRRNGILRVAGFRDAELRPLLRATGHADLAAQASPLEAYEFTDEGFERLLLAGMLDEDDATAPAGSADRREEPGFKPATPASTPVDAAADMAASGRRTARTPVSAEDLFENGAPAAHRRRAENGGAAPTPAAIGPEPWTGGRRDRDETG